MSDLEPPPDPEYVYVDSAEGLDRIAMALGAAGAIAVDTEADSLHSLFEKVCLIQIATDRDDSFILDPLALADLQPLAHPLADPASVKIFHGADFDVVSLRRDFGFHCGNLFDTMVAAQLLGDEKLSLRDLVSRFFGVQLEKAHTRCDWGKRPLSRDELAYSYHDVAFLVPLMEIQRERLEEADLVEEARIEFDRLSLREPTQRQFNRHDWGRIKGAKQLDPVAQSVLAALYAVRYEHAERLDRPLFKVIGNDALMRLARSRPTQLDALRRMKGLSSYARKRMGRDLLRAVERGVERGAPEPRPPTRPDPARRLDARAQKRLGRLRDWRNSAADRTGVTTFAILPNYAMFDVARDRPADLDELAEIEGVGAKRADRWGAEILKQIR